MRNNGLFCLSILGTEANMAVGDRVIVSSGFGSRPGMLKFLGETQFAPGTWCGVMLDDPTGKNDGMVDGIRWVKSNCELIESAANYPAIDRSSQIRFLFVQCESERDRHCDDDN